MLGKREQILRFPDLHLRNPNPFFGKLQTYSRVWNDVDHGVHQISFWPVTTPSSYRVWFRFFSSVFATIHR